MSITVKVQKSNTWKKRLLRSDLRGCTYLMQRGNNKVDIAASGDHQRICMGVLGKPNKPHSLVSYVMWGDVTATELVDLLYAIAGES